VTVPVTLKLSSTVTVPPAESIVKLPDTVSISLSPVRPILILPMSAPVAYTSPNSASLHGVEKSSDDTVSSLVNTNLSDCISKPKKPVATAEPVPHLNLTPQSRPSDVFEVVLSANAITGSSIVTVVDSTVVVVP